MVALFGVSASVDAGAFAGGLGAAAPAVALSSGRSYAGACTATDPLAPPITDPFVSAYVYANDRPTVLVDPGGLRPGRPGGFRDWAGGFADGVKAILPGLRDMAIDGFKCSIGGAVFTDAEEGLRACGRLVMGVPMMFKTAWDCGFNSSHGFLSGDKSQLRAAGGECSATAAVIAADVGIRAVVKSGAATKLQERVVVNERGTIGPETPRPATKSPHVDPADVVGRTPAEIDALARREGLTPKGPDPMSGKGSYTDPVTGQQRVLCHPNACPPHAHVNNPAGERLDINGNVVPPESPAGHLPLGGPR